MTELVYLHDCWKLEDAAKVIAVTTWEKKTAVVLDRTIFYPQGGGQPFDQGRIEGLSGSFEVNEVRKQDDTVYHVGMFALGFFAAGDIVTLRVNKKRRELNSKLHTAGHLIDTGLINLGIHLEPTRGYHFPDGPSVEYKGTMRADEQTRTSVEQEINRLVHEGFEIKIEFIKRDQIKARCKYISGYLPSGKCRIVTVAGTISCPCGGTHVRNIKELGTVVIPKIKVKGETTKISYNVA